MTTPHQDPDRWLALLEAAARLRFGPERTQALAPELAAMAESIARVLAEPLDFDDEPPGDLYERPGA